jgi:hypothetical protein
MAPGLVLPVAARSTRGPAAVSPRVIAAAAAVAAVLVGVLLAREPKLGVALLLALVWVPVALLDLPLAVALWLPLVFLADLPGGSPAAHGASVLILFAWLGHLRARNGAARRWLRAPGPAVMSLTALVGWLILTLA